MSFPVYIDGNTFTPAQQEDFSGRALAAVKAVVDEHEGMIARGTEDKGGLKHFVASAPAEKEGGLFAALEKCPGLIAGLNR